MKKTLNDKKSILKSKLENLKNVVKSEAFRKASKDLVKSAKELTDTMDMFK